MGSGLWVNCGGRYGCAVSNNAECAATEVCDQRQLELRGSPGVFPLPDGSPSVRRQLSPFAFISIADPHMGSNPSASEDPGCTPHLLQRSDMHPVAHLKRCTKHTRLKGTLGRMREVKRRDDISAPAPRVFTIKTQSKDQSRKMAL